VAVTTDRGRGAACIALLAIGLAGCGGGDKKPAAKPPLPPLRQSATVARATPEKTTHAAAKAKKAAQTTASAPTRPASKSKRAPDRPVVCLAQARLRNPQRYRPGLWRGGGSGFPVLVDGPYKNTKDARASAASLAGTSSAESGGLYVVSAAVMGHLDAKVHQVALCLGNGLVGASVPSDPNAQG
jgi:hypothetical protein